MARPRIDRSFRRPRPGGLRGIRRRAKIPAPESEDRRPEILPMRRSPEGRHQAASMQGLRDGLHAANPARRIDGLLGRRLRRVLQLRADRSFGNDEKLSYRRERGCMTAPFICSLPLEDMWRGRGKVRDTTITLAHGGGGKAMRDLIQD